MNTICKILIVVLFGSLFGCAQKPLTDNSCEPRLRALIDVGSGSTKLNLSEVAVCPTGSRLLRVIDDQVSIPVALEAGRDSTGAFTPEVQERAVKAIADLRDKALNLVAEKAAGYKSVDFAAIGTQAFRSASNAASLAEKVKALGISLIAISQQNEGEHGYSSVARVGHGEACKQRNLVAWDVGGASMQISSLDSKSNIQVLPIPYGAENFKRKLLATLPPAKAKRSCTQSKDSPNPIGWTNSARAIKAGTDMARSSLPPGFQMNSRTECVIGIGGVHTKAIEAKIQDAFPAIRSCVCGTEIGCVHFENTYTRKELQCLALYLSDKTDCDPEIKGPYSTTSVSNVFMILGFMELLKIDQVQTLNVNIGRDLVLENSTLPWQPIAITKTDKK